ncbi:MAG: (2Fe-2S)-binding protein [Sphaerochaetaceae bacterium]
MAIEQTVSFTLNGAPITLTVEKQWTLLYVLREVLQLTGTKFACGTSDCGACRVLVDMEAVNSCVYPMRKLDGRQVLTIEGIQGIPRFALVQEAFVEAHAIQCGFCTPGMVISAIGLLAHHPDPTETEVRHALKDNLCRCTGYVNVVEAVLLAAEKMKRLPHGT